MPIFSSILYLDDMRTPTDSRLTVVRTYDQFVKYLYSHDMPELISFDHDLSDEQYPTSGNHKGMDIPYESYREKTGLHCARWIIENEMGLKFWNVHSMNVQGKINITNELRKYRKDGEVNLHIPYTIG